MAKAKKKTPRLVKALFIVGAIVVIYILSLLVPVISNFTSFPLHIIRCEGLPVLASDIAGAGTYRTPESNLYGPHFLSQKVYCSESEAQADGYEFSER